MKQQRPLVEFKFYLKNADCIVFLYDFIKTNYFAKNSRQTNKHTDRQTKTKKDARDRKLCQSLLAYTQLWRLLFINQMVQNIQYI